jgi:hypothetical protein
MHTFTDKAGRQWPIELTVGSARRCRDEAGFNPLDIALGEPADPEAVGITKAQVRLAHDAILFSDVIWSMIRPEAEARKVTREQFDTAFRGEALRSAKAALMEELADFFPPLRPEGARTNPTTDPQSPSTGTPVTTSAGDSPGK